MRSPRLRRNPPPATAAAAAPAPDQFRPGDLVEVLPDEPGYRGAHFPASVTASRANPRGYTVAYDGSGCPLGEVVAASQLRPRPPDAPRGVPPAEHAVVDAFKGGAWWVGVALGGGRAAAGGRVAVCFPETREVVEFDAADVRPHLEWVAGEWLSPENMGISKTMPYKKGTQVEVAKPHPQHASAIIFCINDEVEGFQGNGWWLGVITDVHPEFRYTFKAAHSGKEIQLDQKALRLRYDWTHDQWQQVTQNVTKKFAKGSKVEVTSNDDGFHGAWFQGTALKYVNNKILVEYDALKADDEITPLTEAIEVQHVRPCPPDIPVTSGFNLLDEVDACWNDGWWVGVISKVNSGDRYMVYFRSSTEETEFGHEQLRLHCDWVGGRWMRASLVCCIFPEF
uniref:Agenet domain-containing protein n=1 Tax=Oryza rufipogon TaxID=4529 RepID=A0A0E0PH49_ORYRU